MSKQKRERKSSEEKNEGSKEEDEPDCFRVIAEALRPSQRMTELSQLQEAMKRSEGEPSSKGSEVLVPIQSAAMTGP